MIIGKQGDLVLTHPIFEAYPQISNESQYLFTVMANISLSLPMVLDDFEPERQYFYTECLWGNPPRHNLIWGVPK